MNTEFGWLFILGVPVLMATILSFTGMTRWYEYPLSAIVSVHMVLGTVALLFSPNGASSSVLEILYWTACFSSWIQMRNLGLSIHLILLLSTALVALTCLSISLSSR